MKKSKIYEEIKKFFDKEFHEQCILVGKYSYELSYHNNQKSILICKFDQITKEEVDYWFFHEKDHLIVRVYDNFMSIYTHDVLCSFLDDEKIGIV